MFFEKREFSDWSSYDDFISHSRQLRFIEINTINYKLSKCSCWYWSKYYKCKHMLDLCLRLSYFEYESKARQVPIGANRRRGRPGKTKGALEYQPADEQGIFSGDSESENKKDNLEKCKKGRKYE